MTIAAQLKRQGWRDDVIATAKIDGKPLTEVEATGGKRDSIFVDEAGRVWITIYGTPIAKPRMTQRDKWAKRDCVMRYRDWADRLRKIAAGKIPPVDQIAALNWNAYFEPPRSWTKKKRIESIGKPHRTKPDRDNIDKAVLDSLFKNDSGIACGRIEKLWDWNAGIEIEIILT